MRRLALIACLIASATAAPARAGIVQVPADQPTIQAGLDAALGGDTVLVASGVYSGPGNWDLDFNGQPIVLRSATGDHADCIIDCADAEPHIGVYFHSGEDSSSVLEGFTIQHGVAKYHTDWPGNLAGGGIFCRLSRPLLKNLILRWNRGPGQGMGAGFASDGYIFSDGPILRDCRIEKNSPGSVFVYGRAHFERCRIEQNAVCGIDLHWGRAEFIDCVITDDLVRLYGTTDGNVFRDCTIAAPFEGHHGATIGFYGCSLSGHRLDFFENPLEFYDCTISDCPDGALVVEWSVGLTIEDCLFANNHATTGGAIQLGAGTSASIARTRFENNSAAGRGGAVDIESGESVVFVDCDFLGNSAGGGEGGGAIAAVPGARRQLTRCTVAGNRALGGAPGGAISATFDWSPTLLLNDCLVVGNYSEGAGGALWLTGEIYEAGEIRIQGCTIASNRAGAAGGGLAVDPLLDLTALRCDSTLIWGNCAGLAGDALFIGSPQTAVEFACSVVDSAGVSGGTVSYGTGTSFADPRFCAAPGCDTAPFTETDGFTLEAGSICLPAHNPCGVQIGALGQGCTLTALPAGDAPSAARLAQNYPNPFNATTRFDFTLAEAGPVTLGIFDSAGRERAVLLAAAALGAGPHRLDWDGRDREGRPLPSGVYLCRLCTAGGTLSRKLVLVE